MAFGDRRTPLKRTGGPKRTAGLKRSSRRRADPGRGRLELAPNRPGGYCWFADVLGLDPETCDGGYDPCHLIPKRLLEDAGISSWDRWDERLIVSGCSYHHANSTPDGHLYVVTRELLPIGVEEYAVEHDVVRLLERFYGEGQLELQTAPEVDWDA